MPKSVSAVPLRLLIVEDQPLDAELAVVALERAGYVIASMVRVETAEQFVAQLATAPDAILCDYGLPRFSALAALRLLQEQKLDIPFIILSGSIGEETAVEAIRSGADDYLLKDRLGRLGAAISNAIEEKQLRAAAHRAEEDLRQSEFKYRSLFEHLPDAAYLCDAATGRIIDTNRRGESILGLDRAGILGLRLSHFVPLPTWHALAASGTHTPDAPTELTTEITAAEGRTVPVQVHASIITIYNRRLLFAFFRELSVRKPG